MYSVFLVEDEIVTREGIRNSIHWDQTPFVLAGEAPDGELALPVIRDLKPDILITDIKMPFMDGLALARIVKKDHPWIKIIILSGHDEFHYAQEAISIGVEEFLLKPVSAMDMLNTLDKVRVRIEEEKNRLTGLEDLQLQVKNSEEMRREQFFRDLVSGSYNSAEAIEHARSYKIDLVSAGYVLLLIHLQIEADKKARKNLAGAIINRTIAERTDVFLFMPGVDTYALLYKNSDARLLDDDVYALVQGIKFEIERNTGLIVFIGIGSVTGHVEELSRSYTDADRAVRYMMFNGKHSIISVQDMQWNETGSTLDPDGNQVSERLRSIAPDDIDELIGLYNDIGGGRQGHSVSSSYYLMVFGDIIQVLSSLAEEYQANPRQVIPSAFNTREIQEAAKNKSTFNNEMKKLIMEWIHYRETRLENRHQSVVRRAKQYINEQYMSQDISLNSVAEHINVSPNHFSTVFSQEAGLTFIEYLSSVRINRAKQLLLHSRMKCSDIAGEVGYTDPHYFSFIFKKSVGMSPREYRSRGIED